MDSKLTFRSLMFLALVVGLFAGGSGVVGAQQLCTMTVLRRSQSHVKVAADKRDSSEGQQQQPAPIERRPPAPAPTVGSAPPAHLVGPDGRRGGEHLAEWMNQHSGLTLEQQQRALDGEPGFVELPASTQQHMHDRLAELNAMSPPQRQRLLERTEAMERLSPEQRSQVRGAMQQLSALPPEQRGMVARSFRELSRLPPEQRMAVLNSVQYSWMNDQQRVTLTHLIQIAPMLPPPEPPPQLLPTR